MVKIEIKCECGHIWNYRPRDSNHIPKYPHSKCSKCNTWIHIKRSKLINFSNFKKIDNWKLVRKKLTIGKLVKNLKILKIVGKGFYAKEISQKYSFSASFLSRIINSFKERGLIEQIQSYPKRYKLTIIGKLFLDQGDQGDLNQKKIQEFISGKKKIREILPPIRAHLDRFKNDLIQKPPWLPGIRNVQKRNGLTIKRVPLNNWDKFVVYFNYHDFNGLDNIEICNTKIIYNFRKKLGDQLVSSKEELVDHYKDLILNCKQARSFLQEKGFSIGQEEPVRCQKPQYGVSSKDPRHIGQLGKELLMNIKTDNGSIFIDDSPGIDGEEETDDEEKVFSYFEMPDELEKMKGDLSDLGSKINTLNEKVVQAITKADLNEINSKIKETNEGIMELAKGVKAMAKAMTLLTNQPTQETKENAEAGGMYQ